LIDQRVDGILISLSNKTNEFVHLKKILSRHIPLILFDKIEPSIKCSKVKIDDYKAAYNSVTYLINKGYKKIAHFRGDFNPKNSVDRFKGYKQALIDNHIRFDPALVFMCNNNSDFEDGYSNAEKMISNNIEVDAVFAITDLIAIGVIKYLKEQQIRIPEDIAVFGFSNWFMSSVMSPTLSTVDQPAFEMGETSMEILLTEIRNIKQHKTVIHKEVILPTKLVIRNSC
jgi:LacI family transcriptional regulator